MSVVRSAVHCFLLTRCSAHTHLGIRACFMPRHLHSLYMGLLFHKCINVRDVTSHFNQTSLNPSLGWPDCSCGSVHIFSVLGIFQFNRSIESDWLDLHRDEFGPKTVGHVELIIFPTNIPKQTAKLAQSVLQPIN